MQYAQDYDESFPGLYYYPIITAATGNCFYHFHAVAPYCKNAQLWKCASKVGASFPSDGVQDLGFTANSAISYDYNAALNWGALAMVESPSDVFTYWDADCGWCTSTYLPIDYDQLRAGGAYYGGSPTHNGGQNYAFLDGHSKWLAFASVRYDDIRWSVH